ncbi:hypothetical protein ABET36_09220 [Caldifermentibacillus hisashii]
MTKEIKKDEIKFTYPIKEEKIIVPRIKREVEYNKRKYAESSDIS